MNTVLLTLLTILNYTFGAKDITKIVGGKDLSIEDVPYQVSIQGVNYKNMKIQHYCGGSILTPNHVVTAAHCVAGYAKENMSIVAGTDIWDSGGVRTQVAFYEVHPKYVPLKGYDIAIITLSKPLSFSEKINNIQISPEYIGLNVPCVITGWGYTFPIRALPSVSYWFLLELNLYTRDLKIAQTKTISNEECRIFHSNMDLNTEICTFKFTKGHCAGDSGGPLVDINRKMLIGIVSFGAEICGGLTKKPDGYTRISDFYYWIRSKIGS